MKHSEMYLVILAIFLMVWMLFSRSGGYSGPRDSPLVRAYTDVNGGLKTVLRMFKDDCGRYPTQAEGLKVLIQAPADGSLTNWRGPYFDSAKVPKDPWGREYIYRVPSVHGTNSYDLYSMGPNGRSNDADDIGNWQTGASGK
jgi:general secretion pathway protein G